jgi:hypothetical protein
VDVLKNMSHIVYNGEYPFTLKRNTSLATLAFPGMENGCVAFIIYKGNSNWIPNAGTGIFTIFHWGNYEKLLAKVTKTLLNSNSNQMK